MADSPAVAVSRRYFDAVRRRDLDAALECWAPDGIDHLAPVGELRVPEEWRAYFGELFAAIPDFEYEVLNLFEQGDQVAATGAPRATSRGSRSRASARPERRSPPRAPT